MPKLDPGYVVAALMQRGVPQHVAQGVAMNFQDESGLDTGIQEASPNVHGTRGFGIAQWTDTAPGVGRRTNLMNFARSRGRDPSDPDVQFDFFMHENQGAEAGAWNQVMAAPDARTAAQTFVREWERPAKEHLAVRSAKYSGQEAPQPGSYTPGPAGAQTQVASAAPYQPYEPAKQQPLSPVEEATASMDEIASGLMDRAGGGGGNRSSVPNVQMAKPQAYATEPTEALTLNPQLMQMQRDRLAQAMARLNSGKLWVG